MPNDIRTGFVTQIGMPLEKSLDQAGDMDLDFVEIMMDGEKNRNALEERKDDITDLADEQGLDLVVHLPFKLDIGSPLEHVRTGAVREIKENIETAAAIGAEKAVLHATSNAWSAAWDVEQIQGNILGSVQELHEHGEDHGVEICVENIPSTFFDIHDFPLLFEETDAMMTLDTGHARVSGMDSMDMASFIEEYRDRISHLHLNDTRHPQDEHLPFGAGNLEFDVILAPILDGWDGTLSLEVFTDDWAYMQTSTERLHELI